MWLRSVLLLTFGYLIGNSDGDKKSRFFGTYPCPNYTVWKKSIVIDGAVVQSSGEFHGDCRITFQVPYPDTQRFLLRFESVNIRECHDRLVVYDADDLVDAERLDELSCRSAVDRNRQYYTSNAGGFVTIRYYTYNRGKAASDFRLVLTAVNRNPEAMFCNFRCANNHCISSELRCDADRVNHCGDNSDELNCRDDDHSDSGVDAKEVLGLSITVTIIISLSVLFVCGVCVCSVALFICKRGYTTHSSDLNPRCPNDFHPVPDAHCAILESDASASSSVGSRSQMTYTPVHTDILMPPTPKPGYFQQHQNGNQLAPSYPAMRRDSLMAPGTPRSAISQHAPGSAQHTRIQFSTPDAARRNLFLF